MKLLLKIFKGPIKRILIRELKKESNKEFLTTVINDNIDLPKLTEEEEARLVRDVLEAAIEAVNIAIERL